MVSRPPARLLSPFRVGQPRLQVAAASGKPVRTCKLKIKMWGDLRSRSHRFLLRCSLQKNACMCSGPGLRLLLATADTRASDGTMKPTEATEPRRHGDLQEAGDPRQVGSHHRYALPDQAEAA